LSIPAQDLDAPLPHHPEGRSYVNQDIPQDNETGHTRRRPAAFFGTFAGLIGSWSGADFIKLTNGQRERLRCRANYNVGENGTRLVQSLRCASDSCRFDVNSNIVSEGGTLSGSWTETCRNASGSVSGRVSGGQIQARIDGARIFSAINLKYAR